MPESAELRALLHLHMLERGFSYGRRGFIALSLPIGEARSTADPVEEREDAFDVLLASQEARLADRRSRRPPLEP